MSLLLFFLTLAPSSSGQANERQRAAETYQEQKRRFADQPDDAFQAGAFAKACFDWAEFATNREPRALIAEEGIAAAKRALAKKGNLAALHYYLGLNLGQLARTRSVGALPLVLDMERSFKRAIELDETIDEAGPHRVLGSLYRQAPSWPVSIGSRSKAKRHLLRAAQLAPHYPENRLMLIEALLDYGEVRAAESEFKSVPSTWSAVPTNAPIAWLDRWPEWHDRLAAIRARTSAKLQRPALP